jgi:hypothetical protein
MGRVCLITLVMLLGGCGVAGTGTSTATATAVEPAAQGRQTGERIRRQIGAAEQQATDQRRAAEADGQ